MTNTSISLPAGRDTTCDQCGGPASLLNGRLDPSQTGAPVDLYACSQACALVLIDEAAA